MLSASVWGVLPALSGYFIMSSSLFIVPCSTSVCPFPSAVLGTCEWRQVLTISEWEGKRAEETEGPEFTRRPFKFAYEEIEETWHAQ